jgi:hypothetical protein
MDTAGVSALVDAFCTSNAVTVANRPKLYCLTADALDVDLRYDFAGFLPKQPFLQMEAIKTFIWLI